MSAAARTVFLLARREVLIKLRSRVFQIVTVVVVVLMVGYAGLQSLLINRLSTSHVGVTPDATAISQRLPAAAETINRKVDIKQVPDVAEGEREVRSGQIDALVSGPADAPRVVFKSSVNQQLVSALNLVAGQGALESQLAAGGLDPRVVQARVAQAKAQVSSLEPQPAEQTAREFIGFGVAIILYVALVVYGQFVAQGVVEEKSTRILEMLLPVVRPWQLLAGKLLGIGLVGLLQLVIITGTALAVNARAHVVTIPDIAAVAVVTGLGWFLLGFFFYAVLFAGAASLVSRQEDLQSVSMPVTFLVVGVYLVAINVALSGDPNGTASTVLSLLPPFAPIIMPIRMAAGTAPLWQPAVAAVLVVVAAAAMTWVAGRMYSYSVLRTGGRVKLRDALRGT
jgi:ABC-2 type transport system permease protein